MDRRQRKSREAIFRAFSNLLKRKRYEHISVQDIIDEADISRSTFYAHFETKDMLLKAMCGDIFDHIFSGDLCAYEQQDQSLQSRLAHVLWHLLERKEDVLGILASESGELFMAFFRERLTLLFSQQRKALSVPTDYWMNHLVGSFTETLRWWAKEAMVTPPQTVANYYMQVIGSMGMA